MSTRAPSLFSETVNWSKVQRRLEFKDDRLVSITALDKMIRLEDLLA